MEENNFGGTGEYINPTNEFDLPNVEGYENPVSSAALPVEVSVWSKVKGFLLQDVNREIEITMTPKQAKVLKEVHDFWFQEVNFGSVKDFLFQEIKIT